VSEPKYKSRWLLRLGLVATGLAGVGVVIFRGCWHRKMSWPVRSQGHSYQVCVGCGSKRLFDEKNFRAYGPYGSDLRQLISWDEARLKKFQVETPPVRQRPAS
jgi:hypothetical protein